MSSVLRLIITFLEFYKKKLYFSLFNICKTNISKISISSYGKIWLIKDQNFSFSALQETFVV